MPKNKKDKTAGLHRHRREMSISCHASVSNISKAMWQATNTHKPVEKGPSEAFEAQRHN